MTAGPNPPAGAVASLRRLFDAGTPLRRVQLVAAVVLTMAGSIAELVTTGAVMPVLAIAVAPQSFGSQRFVGPVLGWIAAEAGVSGIVAAAILLTVAALGATCIRLLLAYVSQKVIYGLQQDLVMAIFGNVLRQRYDWYLNQHSSLLISSLEKIYQVTVGVVSPLMLAASSAVMAACVAVLLFVIDPFAVVVATLTIGAVYAGITLVTKNSSKRASTGLSEVRTARIRTMQETLGGIRDIVLDQSQEVFETKVDGLENRYRVLLVSANMQSLAPRLLVEGAAIVLLAGMAASFRLHSGGAVAALPALGALALGAQRLLPMAQTIYHGYVSYAVNKACMHDVLALLETPRNPVRALDRDRPIDEFRDRIELRGVGFAYAGGHRALQAIGMTISKGDRIGLIGRTGSGKSTLVDIIMGLLAPTEGTLTVDGRTIDASTVANWQAQIANVPQAIFLADDSIASNIAFGVPPESIDSARVEQAARKAGLNDFLAALPAGLATHVGERGVRLSGGQRQRIGIARALYKRATLLILDEATSALDDETEAAVMAAVAELDPDLTVILIAHRLTTVSGCDRIYRLEEGRIVQQGEYDEVVGGQLAAPIRPADSVARGR